MPFAPAASIPDEASSLPSAQHENPLPLLLPRVTKKLTAADRARAQILSEPLPPQRVEAPPSIAPHVSPAAVDSADVSPEFIELASEHSEPTRDSADFKGAVDAAARPLTEGELRDVIFPYDPAQRRKIFQVQVDYECQPTRGIPNPGLLCYAIASLQALFAIEVRHNTRIFIVFWSAHIRDAGCARGNLQSMDRMQASQSASG